MVNWMNTNSAMNEKQTWAVIQAISKNEWCAPNQDIRLERWSNFSGASELLRNYLSHLTHPDWASGVKYGHG